MKVLSLRYGGCTSGDSTYQAGAGVNVRSGALYAQLEQLGDNAASPHIDSALLMDVVSMERELSCLLGEYSPQMRLEQFLRPVYNDTGRAVASVVRRMKARIVAHNAALLGDIGELDSWQKYGAVNQRSGTFEFYPDLFIEPKRALLEFQEQVALTQLFVSHVELTRSVYVGHTRDREFLAYRLWWLFRRWRAQRATQRAAAAASTDATQGKR
jgi:hypothetical protein